MSLNKTNDYTIFKKHPSNRPIDSRNLNRIKTSIKLNNMLQFRPILVDSDMRVIDGQHRLEAAKALGFEIYYQIQPSATHQDIVLLNTNQRQWSTENYIDYYIAQGNDNYRRFKDYAIEKGVTLNQLIRFSKGGTERGDSRFLMKDGKLDFFNEEQLAEMDLLFLNLKTIIDTMERYVLSNSKCIKTIKMKQALMNLLRNPALDVNVFIKKIAYKAESIKLCADVYGYYSMMRDIYNWKNANPIE